MRPRLHEKMIQELASYEVKQQEREHENGVNSSVDVLRYFGGAKGMFKVLLPFKYFYLNQSS